MTSRDLLTCAHCGAERTDADFCVACGSSLLDDTPTIQLTSGTVYVVDGVSIELVRREPEGDWSARSGDGRYFLASMWPVGAPNADAETSPDVTADSVASDADHSSTSFGRVDATEVGPPERLAESAEAPRADPLSNTASSSEIDADVDAVAEAQEETAPAGSDSPFVDDADEARPPAPATGAPLEQDALADPDPAFPIDGRKATDADDDSITATPVAEAEPISDPEATPVELIEEAAGRQKDLVQLISVLEGGTHPSLPNSHHIGRVPDGSADMLFVEYEADGEWLPALELSPSDVCRLGGQLAQGLSAIHARGHALTSLRPNAIRWSGRTERAQIARVEGVAAVNEPSRSRSWGIWTAPEVLSGAPLTPACDVFSLATVLGSSLGMYQADEDGAPDWTPNASVDPDLAAALIKCSDPAPESRPPLQSLAVSLGGHRNNVKPAWHAASTVGLVRETQQDAWAGLGLGGSTGGTCELLVMVADGMGGMAAGQIASALAVRVFMQSFQVSKELEPPDNNDASAVERAALQAFDAAVASIAGYAQRHPEDADLGTTFTAAFITGTKALVIHAGDSRCLLLRDGELQQLTNDHTVAARLAEIGEITADEVASHPQSSTLYRSLNAVRAVQPDLKWIELQPGDRLLLASDGVHGLVPTDVISRRLVLPPPTAARALVTDALLYGGHDNATALVVHLEPLAPKGWSDSAS